MTMGGKIKKTRVEMLLSQEELAQKMHVSRSAVAKWETDKGMPDVSNIVKLSKVLNVSLEFLMIESLSDTNKDNDETFNSIEEFMGKKCTIYSNGWHDFAPEVYIVGEDHEFVFYVIPGKKKNTIGAFSKLFIQKIKAEKKYKPLIGEFRALGRNSFVGINVSIKLEKKEGFIAGFFDFRDDKYVDVNIRNFLEDEIVLSFGQKLKVNEITKIEEF